MSAENFIQQHRPDQTERLRDVSEVAFAIQSAFEAWAHRVADNSAQINNVLEQLERLQPHGIIAKLERIHRRLQELEARSSSKFNASIASMAVMQETKRRLEDSHMAFTEMLAKAQEKRAQAQSRLAELRADALELPETLKRLLD